MVLVKTLLFTVVVPGTVTVVLPYLVFSLAGDGGSAPKVLQVLAVVPAAVGVTLYLWCAWDFATIGKGTPAPIDPPKLLVVRGAYRLTRNPMYLGVTGLLVAEALFFGSWQLGVYAAVVVAAFHGFVRFYEEPTLRRLFGKSYEHYCESVPRWFVPRQSRRSGDG